MIKRILKIKKIAKIVILIIISVIIFVYMLAGLIYRQKEMFISMRGMSGNNTQQGGVSGAGEIPLSAEVESYREIVRQVAASFGIEAYLDLLLAVMMQESGGRGNDVFQASESLGLPRNTLTVEQSINQGVLVMSQRLVEAGVLSPADLDHIKTALQGYNFGGGYITFAIANGGIWTQDNTYAYAQMKSNNIPRTGISVERLGPWSYGDQYYTQHVLRYYGFSNTPGNGTAGATDVVTKAIEQLGKPYAWGATGPDTFDCSGLVYYIFKETGKYTGGRLTAAGYKGAAAPISGEEAVPGDLVFFTNASGSTHHIGIYVGNGQMIHAPQTGDVVKYSSVQRNNGDTTSYGRLGG